jgi:OOP family OmpA-OmpF porin
MKFFGAMTALTALAACASVTSISEVEKLNAVTPAGSDFSRSLAAEYRELANFEQFEMYDYRDAQYHAKKGLSAAAGNVPTPTEINERDIDDAHVGELTDARAKLISVLGIGAADRFPTETAIAQTRFDCWIEQQEEGFQFDHIRACKEEFWAAMNALDAKMVEKPKAEVAPTAERFVVFFAWDSSELPGTASTILSNIKRAYDEKGTVSIDVVGHADTSGQTKYNQALSERRAVVVRKALAAAGIPADKIITMGKGESDLLVVTADGVREPSNRRAEIRFK